MTSSFTAPGGNTVMLFRAEPMMSLGIQQTQGEKVAAGTMRMRWVPVKGASNPNFVHVKPPNRTADYVGQIIAVPAPLAEVVS